MLAYRLNVWCGLSWLGVVVQSIMFLDLATFFHILDMWKDSGNVWFFQTVVLGLINPLHQHLVIDLNVETYVTFLLMMMLYGFQ
jgi:hypothetical protein